MATQPAASLPLHLRAPGSGVILLTSSTEHVCVEDAPVTVGGDTPGKTGMLAFGAQDRHLLCHVSTGGETRGRKGLPADHMTPRSPCLYPGSLQPLCLVFV